MLPMKPSRCVLRDEFSRRYFFSLYIDTLGELTNAILEEDGLNLFNQMTGCGGCGLHGDRQEGSNRDSHWEG